MSSPAPMPIPREHGAWGMLLQPFGAALIVAWQWNWAIPAALAAVVVAFVLREPLLVLARQRWLWRDPHPETAAARQALAWELPLLGVLGGLLLWRLPPMPVLALGGLAVAMTLLAVWATLKNKQRAVWLQVLSGFCLSTTALFAALAATGGFPWWAPWLWLLLALHSTAAIFVVHARLAARMSAKKNARPRVKDAVAPQALQFGLAGMAVPLYLPFALPILFSAAMLTWEALRLRKPEVLTEPLRRVGFRMLAIALAHTALTIAALRLPIHHI
ncbi:MAG: YwiC-like family protein [Bryobacteraceae bacterium]